MSEDAAKAGRGGVFGDLPARVASAAALVAAAVGALIAGGVAFILFWLVAATAVHWEWQRLVGGRRPRLRFWAGAAALSVAAALCTQLEADFAMLVVVGGAIVAALLAEPGERVWAGAGVLYAGVLVVSVCAIRPTLSAPLEGPFDLRAIVWLFAVVWVTDVMAYFAGRLIGGPKVWPAISAGKTWSGTLAGVVFGALAGLAIASVRPLVAVSPLPVLGVGLAAAMASQAGDFLESGVKRHFGVKDSSRLIPGHGGVMDRLDGFVAAAAFVALLGLWRDIGSVGEAIFRW